MEIAELIMPTDDAEQPIYKIIIQNERSSSKVKAFHSDLYDLTNNILITQEYITETHDNYHYTYDESD